MLHQMQQKTLNSLYRNNLFNNNIHHYSFLLMLLFACFLLCRLSLEKLLMLFGKHFFIYKAKMIFPLVCVCQCVKKGLFLRTVEIERSTEKRTQTQQKILSLISIHVARFYTYITQRCEIKVIKTINVALLLLLSFFEL